MDVYGLIGNPVEHSLSPPMHEAAYQALDLEASYVTFEPASDAAAAAIESAATLGIAGLNVTVPFKEAVRDAVDTDELASRVGAVNTVDFCTEPPTGHNTDVAGVRRALAHHDIGVDGSRVLVVGAGGAGRAAAFALAAPAETLCIANRTPERAHRLVEDVQAGVDGTDKSDVTAGSLDRLVDWVSDADVLVNATTVGMESDETPVPAELLHADLAVLDAVYRPLETRLLQDARDAGATVVDGAWMLLYQGVEAFELWTDRRAPVDAMNKALRARL